MGGGEDGGRGAGGRGGIWGVREGQELVRKCPFTPQVQLNIRKLLEAPSPDEPHHSSEVDNKTSHIHYCVSLSVY